MPGPLEPQAAYEQAFSIALRATVEEGGLGLRDDQCKRMFDGQPESTLKQLFVAVWSDNSRTSLSRTALNEVDWKVNVTITRLINQPRDRLLHLRDEIETLANRIRALGHKDAWNCNIMNIANGLAQHDSAISGSEFPSTRPIGFTVPMRYVSMGSIEPKTADWFSAEPGSGYEGLAQTIYFGEAQMLQATFTTPTR